MDTRDLLLAANLLLALAGISCQGAPSPAVAVDAGKVSPGGIAKTYTYAALPKEYQELLDEASRVMGTAYNPYSKFSVGAAILTKDGSTASASNVENAAYGSTICAERMAIGKANSLGKRAFRCIAIIGGSASAKTHAIVTPCGSCRQMLYESAQLSGGDFDVLMSDFKKEKIVIAKMKDLLPMAFGPLDVGADVGQYQDK